MAKADLHLHSKYSHHPSDWFLQRIGAAESYTDPDYIYQTAVDMGMDFVTITDHNNAEGSFYLMSKYPDKVFSGVEATTYFPEDGCKIHILIYGFSREQFAEIQYLRKNIYDLRDYIRKNSLAYSVAHATYSVNNKLTASHVEKLILLFDVFEGINGGRNRLSNLSLQKVFSVLDESEIDKLYRQYKIETFGVKSWEKRFTGGSDDHAGIFLTKTFTVAEAKSVGEFVDKIRKGECFPSGRHSDFKSLAFSVYKIAYDFSTSKSKQMNISPIAKITSYIFEPRKLGFFERYKLNRFKKNGSSFETNVRQHISDLIETAESFQSGQIDQKLDFVYNALSNISDEYLKIFLSSLGNNIQKLDLGKLVKDFSTSIPGIFLSVPFVSAFLHMYNNRDTIEELYSRFKVNKTPKGKRILWFTDTINDLNGVSETLKNVDRFAQRFGHDISIVASIDESSKISSDLPANMIKLKPVYSFKMPYYENQMINMPSILKTIKLIYELNPDEIIVSTPGPVGIIGLAAARMLKVKCQGIFHTDFAKEAYEITKKEDLSRIVDIYLRWFYSMMDVILVPSDEYRYILSEKGYPDDKIKLFRRGIDSETFKPYKTDKNIKSNEIKLLFVGRISKDKNLEFLMNVYEKCKLNMPGVKITLAGDGPFLNELKERYGKDKDITFAGRIDNRKLPELYNCHDIFVFPSITDTFGMAVLEAQSSGLPAVVSDIGGPKNIVLDKTTGYVLRANSIDEWVRCILEIADMLVNNKEKYNEICEKSRNYVLKTYNWECVLNDLCCGVQAV